MSELWALEIIPDAALVVDEEGRIVHATRGVREVLAYEPEELVGRPLEVLVPERFRAVHAAHVAGFFAAPRARGMGSGLELYAVRGNGREVPVDVALAPIEYGGERMVLAFVRDVSERAALLAELRASEERYRVLVESASEVFYRVRFGEDPLRGRVEFVSPQCRAVTGYEPEDFVRDPSLWIDAVHPEDRAEVVRLTEELVRTKSERSRYYRVRCRGTGELRWVADRVVPVLDARGEVVGYQGTVRDVTERVRAEEARAELERRLSRAEKMEMLGRLAGGIAHDFNNIVQVIATSCELARAELGAGSVAEPYLREVGEAVERARALASQLLGFSRRQPAAPVALDLAAHVRGLELIVRRALPRDVKLELSFEERAGTVWIDPAQVDQIVMNLVTNARDAMSGGGTLRVVVARVDADADYAVRYCGIPPGSYVKLEVRDTGHGMDAETLAHVFEPFFTTKPEGRGTGLGLATVYGIAKQNHGFVHVESEVGVGTVAVVHLPRRDG